MYTMLFHLHVQLRNLRDCEEGQDLVEYALVVALISLGAVVAMSSLATGINNSYNTLSTKLVNSL
jgi:pilus assembly protein Flp/PilA